jgi:hypothetical protein
MRMEVVSGKNTYEASIKLDGNVAVIAPPNKSRCEDMVVVVRILKCSGGSESGINRKSRASHGHRDTRCSSCESAHCASSSSSSPALLLIATNIMADTHRRSTMQPTADPYGNARSGIPVPSTIKKPPPTNMRMSLSGPALRAPYQQPPTTNPRHSMMRSQSVNPLLQSTTKNGRTPLNRYVLGVERST